MDELLPRLSGPESQQFAVGFSSGGLDCDGFPTRWDSLCCDHIFREKNLAVGEDELLTRRPGLISGQLVVRTDPVPPFKSDAKESGNANALPAPASATSGDSHGATNSHANAAGMSLRSGQIKSHASMSAHAEPATDSDGEQHVGTSLPQKRRRRRKADAEDYVYSQHSDPEEKKLEKRRAKNRRTARASRERKQAELQQMRADLEARTAEVAQLKDVVAARDAQIAQMAAASSPGRGAPPGVGGASTKRGASESAVLQACIYLVSAMLTRRTAPLKTPSPPCLTTCCTASSGDDVPRLKRELRSLFGQLPASEQPLVHRKLQDALGRNGRGKAAAERLHKWLTAEASDESDL